MHELSIALSLIELVEEEAAKRANAPVSAILVKLGPLSGVVAEALISAYTLAREGTPFANCELRITQVPITVHCTHCLETRNVVSQQEIVCSVCGTPTPEILTGRELEVTALEIAQ
jgi:hydrogenase nickel incorporation protein HypA/HybF